MLLDDVQGFLQTVSIDKPGLTAAGNSFQVLSRLGSVYRANKLETKIARLAAVLASISSLPLIYNSEIVQREQQKAKGLKQESHDILKKLETSLRQLIEKELSAISPSLWWKQRIPGDVREEAERRKSTHDKLWPWYDSTSTSLMSFLDFNDYAKIIGRSDNWQDVFVKVFTEKELILAKLRELDPIRKAIAHSRDLGTRDYNRLQLLSEDILIAIRRYYSS